MHRGYILLFAFLAVASGMPAQDAPVEVSACELAKNPGSFDKKMIRVRSVLSVHFEDFSLAIPDCDKHSWIWLAFGGDVPGIVASVANDNIRKPGVDVTVEGVPYGMKKDGNFRKMYALITAGGQEHPRYHVTATMSGRFFAGEESKHADGTSSYSGYGHLGCCSLFLIMEVSDVESIPPANLHLRGTVADPDGKPMEGLTVIDDILGGSPPERQQVLTNDKGEFEFAISGEQLRIEDPRFRPVALAVEPGGVSVRIKLENSRFSDWIIPVCSEVSSAHRVGFSILFALPSEMDSSPFEIDGEESYFIFPKGKEPSSAELIISSYKDKNFDAGDAVGSDQFRQRWIKDSEGKIIGIDARGRAIGHGDWRSASFLNHDGVGYFLSSPRPHAALDQIIDSACVAKH